VQADLGFGGPGLSHLQVAGGTLATGTTAELTLTGVPAFGLAYLVAGIVDAPTPLKGGILVPFPIMITVPVAAGPAGTLIVPGIPGGSGPASLFVQSAHPDASLQGGYGFSNAVRIDLLP